MKELINEISSASGAPACRVIVDPQPAGGGWNMAVDEALLESAVGGGRCTVRWYRWERATLSLGYFQSRDEMLSCRRLTGLPVVRRLSGGGAIVHHHELTYSCTVPAAHALSRNLHGLYTAVHESVIKVLREFGFSSCLRGNSLPGRRGEFLCFGRGDDFDVIMGGCKVLGSAQRRRKGAVLQHGSLILRRSEWVPEFPGVFDCGERAISETDLLERLSAEMGALFSTRWERCSMLRCPESEVTL